jgi:hypothetical protein
LTRMRQKGSQTQLGSGKFQENEGKSGAYLNSVTALGLAHPFNAP